MQGGERLLSMLVTSDDAELFAMFNSESSLMMPEERARNIVAVVVTRFVCP